jgi:hypothetical protein
MRARHALLPLLVMAGCVRGGVDLDGRRVDPIGRGPSVLLFVSPGCPIANRAAPELSRVAARFAGRASFTLVYPDASPDEIRAHVREYALTLPPVRDPRHALVARAHAAVTPEAALFRDGALVWHGRIDDRFSDVAHERPAATTHELEDAVAALVDGRALPPAHDAVGCAIEPR